MCVCVKESQRLSAGAGAGRGVLYIIIIIRRERERERRIVQLGSISERSDLQVRVLQYAKAKWGDDPLISLLIDSQAAMIRFGRNFSSASVASWIKRDKRLGWERERERTTQLTHCRSQDPAGGDHYSNQLVALDSGHLFFLLCKCFLKNCLVFFSFSFSPLR